MEFKFPLIPTDFCFSLSRIVFKTPALLWKIKLNYYARRFMCWWQLFLFSTLSVNKYCTFVRCHSESGFLIMWGAILVVGINVLFEYCRRISFVEIHKIRKLGLLITEMTIYISRYFSWFLKPTIVLVGKVDQFLEGFQIWLLINGSHLCNYYLLYLLSFPYINRCPHTI